MIYKNIFIIEDDCKNELVQSCTECSKIYIDEKLNIAGIIFREQQTKMIENANGKYQYLDCANCPITLNMTEKEYTEVLRDIDSCE